MDYILPSFSTRPIVKVSHLAQKKVHPLPGSCPPHHPHLLFSAPRGRAQRTADSLSQPHPASLQTWQRPGCPPAWMQLPFGKPIPAAKSLLAQLSLPFGDPRASEENLIRWLFSLRLPSVLGGISDSSQVRLCVYLSHCPVSPSLVSASQPRVWHTEAQ